MRLSKLFNPPYTQCVTVYARNRLGLVAGWLTLSGRRADDCLLGVLMGTIVAVDHCEYVYILVYVLLSW